MIFVDTHTHLYLDEFNDDRSEMMTRALKAGVTKVLLPNIDLSTLSALFKMESEFPENVKLMMGLHPCSVKENYTSELTEVENILYSRPFQAVGEIGIDLHWDTSTLNFQEDVFQKQITWGMELGIPVSIHSREATLKVIEILEPMQDGRIKGVFHCFGGSTDEAQRIIQLGMYLGIGGVLTYKNSVLPEVIQSIGLDKVVLETDAPYLSPVPFRGKRNESSYLIHIAQKLADITYIKLEQVATITSQNAASIFSLTI
ncbi:MAG: TatD family hydrolase [Bacteroidota bacterium]|nr:TatD family hydrolase [Bacteroidota bacterium]